MAHRFLPDRVSLGGLAQPVEAAPQARVDGAARQLEHPRDLARRVLEQVAQHDDRALLGRQLLQRRDHLARRLGRRGSGEDGLGAVDPLPQRLAPGQSSARLTTIRCSQGAKGTAAVEAVEGVDRGEKGVLGDVLGRAARGRRGRRRGRRRASAASRAAPSPRRTRPGPRARVAARSASRSSALRRSLPHLNLLHPAPHPRRAVGGAEKGKDREKCGHHQEYG